MAKSRLIRLALFVLLFSAPAQAQFDESGFRQALKLKKGIYLPNGSFSGGDRLSSDFQVVSVRAASNPEGYDRLVIDFSKVKRPPFFLIQNDSQADRVLVTIYGKVKLDFSSQSTLQAAKKTKTLKRIDFFPLVENDRWVWAAHTQGPVKMEVFELSDPARIIIDLKP
jgi:hypothetical protein